MILKQLMKVLKTDDPYIRGSYVLQKVSRKLKSWIVKELYGKKSFLYVILA